MSKPAIGTVTLRDFDGETTTTRYNLPRVLDDGSNYTAVWTAFDALVAAQAQITDGNLANRQMLITNRGTALPSTTQSSQRESKWVVSYVDITENFDDGSGNLFPNSGFQKIQTLEIGTAILSKRSNNSEVVYTPAMQVAGTVDADVQTWVTTFENNALSPTGGSINVLEIRSGGRRT